MWGLNEIIQVQLLKPQEGKSSQTWVLEFILSFAMLKTIDPGSFH